MEIFSGNSAISQVIGQALAPAFLLVGIGAILSVLTSRLGRIVDRARQLEDEIAHAGEADCDRPRAELGALHRRMTSAHWAISLCTASALCVCLVVAVLFLGSLRGIDTGITVAGLFILAMLLLVVGLMLFLVEIYVATRSVKVRRDLLLRR